MNSSPGSHLGCLSDCQENLRCRIHQADVYKYSDCSKEKAPEQSPSNNDGSDKTEYNFKGNNIENHRNASNTQIPFLEKQRNTFTLLPDRAHFRLQTESELAGISYLRSSSLSSESVQLRLLFLEYVHMLRKQPFHC